MRGYASQAVIVFHFFSISALLRGSILSSIPLSWNSGVDFFFVLSGFLLSIPFISAEKPDLKGYYIKRAFRILPTYYVSLACTILFLSHGLTTQQVTTSFFFLQSFNPNTFDRINGVYWTLAIEEIFYATLPIFSYFFMKRRWVYSLPICIAFSIAYRLVMYASFGNNLYYLNFYLWQYPSYVADYAIGATLANFFVFDKMRPGKYKTAYPLMLTGGLLILTQFIVGSTYSAVDSGYNFPTVNMIFAFEYAGILYFTLTSPIASSIRALFRNKAAAFAGKISYSAYVWHLPIEIAVFSMGVPLMIWIPVSYCLAMSLATLSYYYVERPFLSFRNRFVSFRVRKEGVPNPVVPPERTPITQRLVALLRR